MSKTKSSDTAGRVLSSTYLERSSSKNDLLRRLRKIVEELEDDDIEPLSPDYPGLNGLANSLVQDKYLAHPDKEVRLHTVLACVEIFTIYAPEPPWDEAEILKVFSQMIRQLGNLAHCTSPSQTNFSHYTSLLEQLAVVKIGAVLVELTKTLDSASEPTADEALEVLCDLVRTILQSVHIDHPQELHSHAVSAVVACLDEFDTNIPIPVLDEILICVAQGSVVYVTNPAAVEAAAKYAKKKKTKDDNEKMPPLQIQQTNPSYMVAASIIRRTVDRISTPIAYFLNGLLNGDPNVVSKTSISTDDPSNNDPTNKQADVWTIIYELHRIAPSVLTTVIGTVTTSLQDPQLAKRLRVTKLLGRLFYATSSKIAVQFRLCFREWLGRANDCEVNVRQAMVKCLVTILTNKGNEKDLVTETTEILVKMVEHDPDNTVRLQAIHQICDLAYSQKVSTEPQAGSTSSISQAFVPARLLQAVGSRVSSKVKTERKDALSGLAQIYHKHYLLQKVKQVELGGENCSIDIIVETLQGCCGDLSASKRNHRNLSQTENSNSDDLAEKYSWIPRKVFESASFTDTLDPEMRNRVIQIVDDVLLGSSSAKKGGLTPTSRSVGLAIILESLRCDSDELGSYSNSNSLNWMSILLTQRANLQKSLGDYIDARTKLREFKSGTEEAITANADAMEKLELVASFTAPSTGANAEISPILEKLHNARDNHIFRVLATIANPSHSSSARDRAFDELPKRTKSLGDQTASWVKTLARRCAMGNFLNVEIIHHSILLAQECFGEGNLQSCMHLLSSVRLAAKIFPSLCATKEEFGTLLELFSECRAVSSSKSKTGVENSRIITALSGILAQVSPVLAKNDAEGIDSDVQAQLLRLCTKDGTPDQARHAVYTMAGLLNTSNVINSESNDSTPFEPLLKALTSPSLLAESGGSSKILSVLAALAALSDAVPSLFLGDERGTKAIRFALDTVLLGRRGSVDSDDDKSMSEGDEHTEPATPKSMVKRSGTKSLGEKTPGRQTNSTPKEKGHFLEDESLSIPCRRACASIEFLISFVRASILQSVKTKNSGETSNLPQMNQIEKIFDVLHQILQDRGLPPSTVDRRSCKTRQDRAALRECAAVHMFRLCDPRMQLDKRFFTNSMWYTLSGLLLDEERSVRNGVITELSDMLTGKGKYCQGGAAMAPSLRFLALIVLCADGDNNGSHSAANGNAANVGKRSHHAKNAALQCVTSLRNTCDTTLQQCRAIGKKAEEKFESSLKMLLMPEYAVPYALHLLSMRKETPSAGGVAAGIPGLTQISASSQGLEDKEEEEFTVDDEAQHKMLRKRLKWLFDPLVQSLGDGADNISFLLRMTEVLGTHYQPNDVRVIGSFSSQSNASEDRKNSLKVDVALSVGKLKTTCVAAREVLLRFVKNDANLSTYPGSIQLPLTLFQKLPTLAPRQSAEAALSVVRNASKNTRRARASLGSQDSDNAIDRSSLSLESNNTAPSFQSNAGSSLAKTSRPVSNKNKRESTGKNRVHFSPELVIRKKGENNSAAGIELTTPVFDDDNTVEFGNLSPIASSSPSPTQSEKTAGTTPPSVLRTLLTDREAYNIDLTDEESKLSAKSPSPKSHSSLLKALTQESSQTTSETHFTIDAEEGQKATRAVSRKFTALVTAKERKATVQLQMFVDRDVGSDYEQQNASKISKEPAAARRRTSNKVTIPKIPSSLRESLERNTDEGYKLSKPEKHSETKNHKTSIKVNIPSKQRLPHDPANSIERGTRPKRKKSVASRSPRSELPEFDDDMNFNEDSEGDDVIHENPKRRKKTTANSSKGFVKPSRKPFGLNNISGGRSSGNKTTGSNRTEKRAKA